MIKGLVGGLRTLCLAFALLFSVLYMIAVFATIAIGRGLTGQVAPGREVVGQACYQGHASVTPTSVGPAFCWKLWHHLKTGCTDNMY